MMVKSLIISCIVGVGVSAYAHEGGHGHEEGACGELMGQVSKEKNAELVKGSGGTVEIMPCGHGREAMMKDKAGKATIKSKGGKPVSMDLTFDGTKYVGKLPKDTKSGEVIFTSGGKKATFTGVD